MANPPAEIDSPADDVAALVLGGGRGTRLHPLTAVRAKPAVPLFGRYRLVDIPLSNCIHSGVHRIFVLTQFNSASLNRHINTTYKFDAFSGGFIEVLAAEQTAESGDWFQGTADAVRKHLRHFATHGAKHYLILSGDQLYQMDYRALLATHLQTQADITIAVLPVAREAAGGLGILKVSPNGRITEFVEKPSNRKQLDRLVTHPRMFAKRGLDAAGREHLASMGVYLFRAEVLETLLQEQQDWVDFGKDVIPNSLRTHRVFAHLFTGFWEDIGTVGTYYKVSMRMVKANPPFDLHDPRQPIYTHPRYLPGAQLQDAVIKNSIVCEGSRILGASISNSIIGIRTIIRPKTTIEHSVIMGADYFEEGPNRTPIPIGIGSGSRISRAIIDKNARIGKRVTIRGSSKLRNCDGDGFAVRDSIVIILKNATIPDRTQIG